MTLSNRALWALMFLLTSLLASGTGEAKSVRDPKVRAEFQRLNPCPNKEWQIRPGTQGGRRGACPGFQVDHVIALVCGGRDSVDNLQWLSVEAHKAKTREDIKNCRRKR